MAATDVMLEAEPLIERSLTLLRQKPGPKHRGVLQTLDGLALVPPGPRTTDEAEPYYQEVLAAREELLGPNQPRVARTLENNARLLWETGRKAEAKVARGTRKSDTRPLRYNDNRRRQNDHHT